MVCSRAADAEASEERAPARPADQFHRIGILHSGTEAAVARYLATFHDGMRQLGYVEGRNIHYDYHFDDGQM